MFPGQVVHGHVDSIAPASGQEFALLPPDNATGNFTKVVQRIPVKIALDTGKHRSPSNCGRACRSFPTIETQVASATRAAARRTPTSSETVSGASCHVRSCPVSLDIRAADLARSI